MGATTTSRPEPGIPGGADTYTWTFPGAPVRIRLRLDVIPRLLAAVSPAEPSDPGAQPAEAGGILLGRPGTPPATVEIGGIVAVPCAPAPDGRYSLDIAALKRLREERPWAKTDAAGRLSVVGYFRSQSQGMLNLREDELDLVRKEFRDPASVVLLIQNSTEPFNAGFLFWDGDTFAPFSFMDFPLDQEALRLAAARKPVQSAVIESAGPVQAEPEQAEPVPPAAGEQPKQRWRWLLAASVLLLVLSAIPAYLLRDRWLPALASGSSAPAAPSTLQLQVEAQGNGLNVRWDRQSPAIAQAREGRLWIMESNRPPQVVALAAEELKTGHVYYQSSAERLQFRLEVVDVAGRLTRETVLALSSLAPAGTPSAEQPARDAQPVRQVRSVPIPDNTERPAAPPAAEPPRPARPFTPPPESPGSGQPEGIVLDSPPVVAGGAPITSAVRPPVPAGSVTLPAAPPPPVQPAAESDAVGSQPAPAAAAGSPAVRTSVPESYQQPVPRTLVRPIVGASVRALIQRDVEITVRVDIDETGKVVKAEAISHDQSLGGYLEKSAISAAMRCRFEPASMGGKAIPSSHTLRFSFRKP